MSNRISKRVDQILNERVDRGRIEIRERSQSEHVAVATGSDENYILYVREGLIDPLAVAGLNIALSDLRADRRVTDDEFRDFLLKSFTEREGAAS